MAKKDELGQIAPWNPTPEEFERYKAREIVIARHNFKGMMHRDVGTLRQSCLHSDDTIRAAVSQSQD